MSISEKKYLLSEVFGLFLWERMSAVKLRDQVLTDQCAEAIIDFTNVKGITRAFADELEKVKHFLQEKGVVLTWINVSSDVAPMLEIVQAGRDHLKR